MIAIVSVWDSLPKIKEFLKNIRINPTVSRVVILAQEEWAYYHFVNLSMAFEQIVNAAKNLPIDIVVGGHESSPPGYNVNNPRYKNVNIHYWPTYWMTYFGYNLPGQLDNTPVDKLFCLLNGNAHTHRCLTMDLLCRDNLLDNGYISWYDLKNSENYEFKYWTPEHLILDTFDNSRNLFTVPPEYSRAFVNIVSEGDVLTYFFTEKTTKPLYYKKPFLVISKEGYHTKFLVELGFKLYDEVFDYSFDLIADQSNRIEAVIQELKRFENHSHAQLEELTIQIRDKLEYNQKHLTSLMHDVNIWPKIILDLLNDEYFQTNNNLPVMYDYCKKIKENL
jgi:hypothetical protein